MPRTVDSLDETNRLEMRVSSLHWAHMEAVRNITATATPPLEMCRRRAEADNAFAVSFEKICRKWRRANQRILNQNARATRRAEGRELEICAREKFVVLVHSLLPLTPHNLQTAVEAHERLNQELDEIRADTEADEIVAVALAAEMDRQSEASNRMDEAPPTSDVEQMSE